MLARLSRHKKVTFLVVGLLIVVIGASVITARIITQYNSNNNQLSSSTVSGSYSLAYQPAEHGGQFDLGTLSVKDYHGKTVTVGFMPKGKVVSTLNQPETLMYENGDALLWFLLVRDGTDPYIVVVHVYNMSPEIDIRINSCSKGATDIVQTTCAGFFPTLVA